VRASGILVGLAILVALPSLAAAQQAPAAAAKAAPSLDTLVGRWVRSEGGYVVEIRSVAPDGKLQASYFNPRSIHVGKAEAVRKGSAIEVFIELRDVNYPGSTYTLTYDPKSDRLVGRYYQAVARETFDVFFVRMKQ
jgi:uncharacterized protein (DUF2147 family)